MFIKSGIKLELGRLLTEVTSSLKFYIVMEK